MKQRRQTLDAREVQAVLQPLHHVDPVVLADLVVGLDPGQGLDQRVVVDDQGPGGKDLHPLERVAAALVVGFEQTQRLDLVAEEFDPHRQGVARAEDVDQSATDRHVARHLDESRGAVAHLRQALTEAVGVDLLSHAQFHARGAQGLARHHLVTQAVQGGDVEARLAAVEVVQPGLDRGQDVTRGRLAIEGQDLELGQVVDRRDVEGVQVVDQRLGPREVRGHDQPHALGFAVQPGQGIPRRSAQQSRDRQVLIGPSQQTVDPAQAVEPVVDTARGGPAHVLGGFHGAKG